MQGRSLNHFLTPTRDFGCISPEGMGKIPMSSTFIKELIDDTSGATAIEYGLIVSLIVIAMIFSLQSVASTTIEMWDDVETRAVDAMTN